MLSLHHRDRLHALLCASGGLAVAFALYLGMTAEADGSVARAIVDVPGVFLLAGLVLLAYSVLAGPAAASLARRAGGGIVGPLFAVSSVVVAVLAGGLFSLWRNGAPLTAADEYVLVSLALVLLYGGIPAFLLGCVFTLIVRRGVGRPSSKLDNLKPREYILGDPEELVHIDWSGGVRDR